jgi:predicted permease
VYSPFALSYPDIADIRRELTQVSGLAGYHRTELNVAVEGSVPRRLVAEPVTADYFEVLGVDVAVGRAFSGAADDPASGGTPVAIISHRLWLSAFGGDPAAVGAPLWANGLRLTIIGVAPARFLGLDRVRQTDLWVPGTLRAVLDRRPENYAARDAGVYVMFVIRLAPGATLGAAEAELNAAADAIAPLRGDSHSRDEMLTASFELYPGFVVGRSASLSRTLRLLAIVVGLVLLIACSNVASLLLVGGLYRRSELAVRKALGAGSWRLTRQHLTEGVLLWVLGGAAGLMASAGMVRLFEGTLRVGNRFVASVDIDYRVMAFAASVSLVAGMVFAAVPAVSIGRSSASRWLSEGGRTTRGIWRHARSGFTVVQLAASLTLVLGASLFVRTLESLNDVERGFDPHGVTMVGLSVGDQGYDRERVAVYYDELVEGLRARPGIETVGLGTRAPFGSGRNGMSVRPAGADEDAAIRGVPSNFVSGDFFRALDMPVLRGRAFADTTAGQTPDEVVLSRSLAARLFGEGAALGRSVIGGISGKEYRVIGVVADVRYNDRTEDSVLIAYYPSGEMLGRLQLFVQGRDRDADLAPVIRAVATDLDPLLPPAEIASLGEIIYRARADTHLFVRLVGGLSLIALTISAVGLFGLVSFTVVGRNHELGVRMALGATPASVRTMVLRGAVLLALVGVGVGTAAAWAGRRLIESHLSGVTPLDPTSWAVAVASLLAVAVAAALIPARRATRIDPVQTLRNA